MQIDFESGLVQPRQDIPQFFRALRSATHQGSCRIRDGQAMGLTDTGKPVREGISRWSKRGGHNSFTKSKTEVMSSTSQGNKLLFLA